jgi:putative colanic acid biosynthesis UDP-glucose lipid carrier transferase
LLIGYATKTSASFSRRALFLWVTITPPLLVAAITIVHVWARAITASPRNARKAIIVGGNNMSERLAAAITARPERGIRLDRVFDVRDCSRTREPRALDVAAIDCERIAEYVNEHRIDVVFIALPIHGEDTRTILNGLRDTTSSVYVVPDIALYDLIQARSDEIDGIPVIALCESPLHGTRGLTKRGTDLVFASLLTLCALPLMACIAAAIRLTSRGPVIFKQHRYGLDGERITVYKFRTMTVTENGRRIRQATRGDPRVTAVGRFLRRTSLDELPQLFNVLGGSMSLVGPRPHAVAHNEQYRKLVRGYMVRHKVAPGITGLAQVNGCRGETATVDEMRRRVEYDLEYLRHWCWLLDLKILAKTVALLFRDDRAY